MLLTSLYLVGIFSLQLMTACSIFNNFMKWKGSLIILRNIYYCIFYYW